MAVDKGGSWKRRDAGEARTLGFQELLTGFPDWTASRSRATVPGSCWHGPDGEPEGPARPGEWGLCEVPLPLVLVTGRLVWGSCVPDAPSSGSALPPSTLPCSPPGQAFGPPPPGPHGPLSALVPRKPLLVLTASPSLAVCPSLGFPGTEAQPRRDELPALDPGCGFSPPGRPPTTHPPRAPFSLLPPGSPPASSPPGVTPASLR